MKFILNRDRTVVSTLGYSIAFKKGVATHVPPEMYVDVIAAGAAPEEDLPEEVVKKADFPTDPAEREAALFEAFEALALRNDPADFTAGGSPRDGVLEKAVGFKVPAKEREAAWTKFKIGKED